MQQDKNRNEISGEMTVGMTVMTLEQRRQALMSFAPTGDAPVIEFGGKIYQFLRTDDGSPSIRMTDVEQRPEAMHHSGGALAESVFIYGEALREGLNHQAPPRVLSVGLGCGYNEWIAIAEARAKFKTPLPNDFYLESFEADDVLRGEFVQFLLGISPDGELGQHLHETFRATLACVAAHYGASTEELMNLGQQLYGDGDWQNRARLTPATGFATTFGAIFFDAFSTKATPDLWREDFLEEFLRLTSAETCVLATYAAVGALNRSLKKTGFELTNQPGFQFKRESTRAFRRAKLGSKDLDV